MQRQSTYRLRTIGLSSAGAGPVTDASDVEVAAIEAKRGGLFSGGPTWTWVGAFGPEWVLTATQSTRAYQLTRSDGSEVATFSRGMFSVSVEVALASGRKTFSAASQSRLRQREWAVTLPDGSLASVRRGKREGIMGADVWHLEHRAQVGADELVALQALPILIDHRVKRQRNNS